MSTMVTVRTAVSLPAVAVTVTFSAPSTNRSSVTVKLNSPVARDSPSGMVTVKSATAA